MDTSLKKFRESLLSRLLDFLWDRWSDLGVAGDVRREDDRIVDPEALLLFSFTVARFDARLFDEILDWLTVNGAFLNVQRLQNLIKSYGFSGGPALSAATRLLQKTGPYRLKWKMIAAAYQASGEPLFRFPTGAPLPLPPAPDATFATCGLLRGVVRLRGKSKPFFDRDPSSLILRLRGLFGVSVRSELLALLAAKEETYPSEAARQTGYYQRSVLDALNEMERSGAVRCVAVGKTKRYRLTPGILDTLLMPEGKRPCWVSWGPLFRALEMILQKLYDERLEQCDDLLCSSEMRQLMLAVRPLLEAAGFGQLITDPASYRGKEYLDVFFSDIDRLVSAGTGDKPI
jgi:hypothetical protein